MGEKINNFVFIWYMLGSEYIVLFSPMIPSGYSSYTTTWLYKHMSSLHLTWACFVYWIWIKSSNLKWKLVKLHLLKNKNKLRKKYRIITEDKNISSACCVPSVAFSYGSRFPTNRASIKSFKLWLKITFFLLVVNCLYICWFFYCHPANVNSKKNSSVCFSPSLLCRELGYNQANGLSWVTHYPQRLLNVFTHPTEYS